MKGTAPDRSDLQTLLTKANNSKTRSASLDWLMSAKYAYTVTVDTKDEDQLPLWTLWDMNGTQPKETYSFNIEIDEFLEYLKPYGTIEGPSLHAADEEPVHNNVVQFKRRSD
jgi:hypothetical protein